MKRPYFIVLLLFLISFSAAAQLKLEKHPSILGVHFFLDGFRDRKLFSSLGSGDPGIGITYIKGFRTQLDWVFSFNGSFPDSAVSNKTDHKKDLLAEAQATLRLRLVKGFRPLQPFISAGIGGSSYANNYDLIFAPGAGVQIQCKSIYFLFTLQYHTALTGALSNHFSYSMGIGGALSHHPVKTKRAIVIAPAAIDFLPKDRDGDGIYDSTDACPDTPGLLAFAGCPDTDGDGIADKEDQCPSVFGMLRYHGCPPPDRDGDGINDEEDSCPDTPGFIKYKGCPIPDTDGDGVNDEADRCITTPGIRENFGCPPVEKALIEEFNKAAANIFFKTGSYELLSVSFSALDKVMNLLEKNTTLFLVIEGHTDNIGKDEANQLLSEQRANTVMEYFKSKGIDKQRLRSIGYGASQPRMDNTTGKGRAANRRVEFKLKYMDK